MLHVLVSCLHEHQAQAARHWPRSESDPLLHFTLAILDRTYAFIAGGGEGQAHNGSSPAIEQEGPRLGLSKRKRTI